ncbi:MAG: hypothetical protein RIB59_01740, partial [Rhodospirillales bacterium]
GMKNMNDRNKAEPVSRKRIGERRGFLLALGAALLVLPLAACGRKASPDKPKDSKFPREYPTK